MDVRTGWANVCKAPRKQLQMVIRVLVLKVWFESRSWVQQAHSGTGEVSMVTAEEVNSDF